MSTTHRSRRLGLPTALIALRTRLAAPGDPLRSRLIAGALAASLLLVPAGGGALAEDLLPTSTTPAATTPEATTPTTPPVDPLTLTLEKPANLTDAAWSSPGAVAEEQKVSLRVQGTADGQLTYHAAFLKDVATCPASPLYPRQVATGARITITPTAGTGIGTTPAAGSFDQPFSVTPRDSGWQRLCAWVLAAPASSEASTRSRLDLAVNVASRPAELSVSAPDAVRSGDYFTAALTGKTAASGRRALIMADTDRGQDCAAMRKSTSKKRGLQSVVGVASGAFSKTTKLRFRTKTAGSFRLCVQIVEASDRNPEAVFTKVITVTEQMKCVATQTALTQRRADLELIRKRRDTAQARVSTIRKKAAPVRKRVSALRKASNRRIARASKAARKAKSAAGRKKASRRLANLRRSEQRRIYRASASLRKLDAQIKYHERTYRQYRTGANLLQQTITRTQKDAKKYCANP